jgi:hypothetical protein
LALLSLGFMSLVVFVPDRLPVEGTMVHKVLYPHHKKFFVFPLETDAPAWGPLLFNPHPTSPDKR